ncbi:hypothetical protein B0H13DRAFT_2337585 [Mycena leptocephala]|nr:hypothetical protein B0H13DRAFT_2337585 [Mycena leptocephala]
MHEIDLRNLAAFKGHCAPTVVSHAPPAHQGARHARQSFQLKSTRLRDRRRCPRVSRPPVQRRPGAATDFSHDRRLSLHAGHLLSRIPNPNHRLSIQDRAFPSRKAPSHLSPPPPSPTKGAISHVPFVPHPRSNRYTAHKSPPPPFTVLLLCSNTRHHLHPSIDLGYTPPPARMRPRPRFVLAQCALVHSGRAMLTAQCQAP